MSSCREVADILQVFESAWRRGERPVIETYLSALADRAADRGELLTELVHIELELLLKTGESARVEDYIARFPVLAESREDLLDLVVAEFDFRRRREGRVDLAEYQRRFPDLSDELAKRLVATQDSSFPRITGYELREVLGHGGMGRVYKAWQPRLRRWVAIKVLNSQREVDERAVARFDREMAALGQLDHPNLVRAVDAGESNGLQFLVMEYVAGYDAAWLSQRLGPWPLAEACELIRQTALGLQAAHDRGLVHRDLKPSNVMVSESGEVKVLDLGLALWSSPGDDERTSLLGDITSTGMVMGTVDYMAPEQADDSHTVDLRADLYSLGASLFKLLTGKAPFADAGSHAKRFAAVVNSPPPRIESLRPDLPRTLVTIIDRLLQKNPADRYASAKDVFSAITPFCDGADLKAVVEDRVPSSVVTPNDPPMVTEIDTPLSVTASGNPISRNALASGSKPGESNQPLAPNKLGDSDKPDASAFRLMGGANIRSLSQPGDPDSEHTQLSEPPVTREPLVATARPVSRRGFALIVASLLLVVAAIGGWWWHRPPAPVIEPLIYPPGPFAMDPLPDADKPIDPVPAFPEIAAVAERAAEPIDWIKTRSPLDELQPIQIPGHLRRSWHPKELIAVLGDELQREWAPILRMGFSPDGKYVVSSAPFHGQKIGLRVWRSKDFREIAPSWTGTFEMALVQIIDFFADGTMLTVEQDSHAKLWTIRDDGLTLRQSFKLDGQVVAGALSPNGKLLATVAYTSRDIRLTALDGFQPRQIGTLPRPGGEGAFQPQFQFSVDGRVLSVNDHRGHVTMWDMATEPPTKTASIDVGTSANGTFATMSPDATKIAYQQFGDGRLRFWDVSVGREMEDKQIPIQNGKAIFANDRLVHFGQHDLRVIQDPLGNPKSTSIGFPKTRLHVQSLAASRDGNFIAATGLTGERLHLWRRNQTALADAPEYVEFNTSVVPDVFASAMTFSDDAQRIGLLHWVGAANESALGIWDLNSRHIKLSREIPSAIQDSWMIQPRVRFNSTFDGDQVQELTRFFMGASRPGMICTSVRPPQNNAVADGHVDGKLSLSTAVGPGEIKRIEWAGHAGRVTRVLFSADGSKLASWGEADRFVRVWDMTVDPPAKLYETLLLDGKRTDGLRSLILAFSPDGSRLAIGGGGVWDWDLSQPKPRQLGIEGAPNWEGDQLAYSPDGKKLLVGGGDFFKQYSVVLWDVERDQLAKGWKLPRLTLSVAFAPDGRHIGWVNSNRTAYLLRLAEPHKEAVALVAPKRPDIEVRQDAPEFDRATRMHGSRTRQSSVPSIAIPSPSVPRETADPSKTSEVLRLPLRDIARSAHHAERDGYVGGFSPLAVDALVTDPAPLPGIVAWTIESKHHRGGLSHVAYSPDGTKLATAGTWDRTIRIWDTAKGELLKVFYGHGRINWAADTTLRVAWSADGKEVISVSTIDGHIRWWDAATGRLLRARRTLERIPSGGRARPALLSPDGKRIAYFAENVVICDTESGEVQHSLFGGTAPSRDDLAWSPDGKRLAIPTGKAVEIWDTTTARLLRSLEGAIPNSHWLATWSPDGTKLAIGSQRGDGTKDSVRIVDADFGKPLTTIEVGARLAQLHWSPDGSRIACSHQDECQVWEVVTAKLISRSSSGVGGIGEWSPDGSELALRHSYNATGRFWNPTKNSQRGQFAVRFLGTVALDADAQRISQSVNDQDFEVWNLRTLKPPLSVHTDAILTAGGPHFRSRSDEMISSELDQASGKKSLIARDVSSGTYMRTLGSIVTVAAISPDGKLVAALSDNTLEVRDAESGEIRLNIPRDPGQSYKIPIWSPDSSLLALSRDDTQGVICRDVVTGKILDNTKERCRCFAISPDNTLALTAYSHGGIAELRRLPSWELIDSWQCRSGGVAAACWSPDGRSIAVKANRDNRILIFETDRLRLKQVLRGIGEFSRINGEEMRWSADSRTIVTGSPLQWWDVETGQLLKRWLWLGPGQSVAIAPNGHYLASPGAEHLLHYVVLTTTGEQQLLTPAEFSQRFAWKNDPTQVPPLDGTGKPSAASAK